MLGVAAATCFLSFLPGGVRPDIGAYQADGEDPWVPGAPFRRRANEAGWPHAGGGGLDSKPFFARSKDHKRNPEGEDACFESGCRSR